LFFLDISHNPYEGGVGVVIIETWGVGRYYGKIIFSPTHEGGGCRIYQGKIGSMRVEVGEYIMYFTEKWGGLNIRENYCGGIYERNIIVFP